MRKLMILLLFTVLWSCERNEPGFILPVEYECKVSAIGRMGTPEINDNIILIPLLSQELSGYLMAVKLHEGYFINLVTLDGIMTNLNTDVEFCTMTVENNIVQSVKFAEDTKGDPTLREFLSCYREKRKHQNDSDFFYFICDIFRPECAMSAMMVCMAELYNKDSRYIKAK